MCPRYLRSIVLASLVCFISVSCKPHVEEQNAPKEQPAPKVATKQPVKVTPAARPEQRPPLYPAGVFTKGQSETKITRGEEWEAKKDATKTTETHLLPGDLVQVPKGATAAVNVRRLGLVELAGGSQIRFPEHAPCGVEHWLGSLSLEGPPFFEKYINNCWVHTPTAAIFSGNGKADIHVAPGGQTLVHNHKGTLIIVDHDIVMRQIAQGESAMIEWDETTTQVEPQPGKKVPAFIQGHPLDRKTARHIGEVGQSWSKRFTQEYETAKDLAVQHHSIMLDREELAKLGKAGAIAKSREIAMKLGPLLPKRYVAKRNLTVIFHRMNHIRRLAAPSDPEAFASYDETATAVLKRFPQDFQLGPSRKMPRLKPPQNRTPR